MKSPDHVCVYAHMCMCVCVCVFVHMCICVYTGVLTVGVAGVRDMVMVNVCTDMVCVSLCACVCVCVCVCSRGGKSSIQKVVFHKLSPNETLFLESTSKVVKDDINNSSFVQFQVSK